MEEIKKKDKKNNKTMHIPADVSDNGKCTLCSDNCTQYSIKFNACYSRLRQLQQCAIHEVVARTSDTNKATSLDELNSLHVAAYMDIEKATQSLNNILVYKKQLALAMLQCSDEEQMKILAENIKYSDDMIQKVLGMYVP